jgi:hypothetical protein
MLACSCSDSRFAVMPGSAEMIELPDGSYLEVDCRDDDSICVTHWVDGDCGQSISWSV